MQYMKYHSDRSNQFYLLIPLFFFPPTWTIIQILMAGGGERQPLNNVMYVKGRAHYKNNSALHNFSQTFVLE